MGAPAKGEVTFHPAFDIQFIWSFEYHGVSVGGTEEHPHFLSGADVLAFHFDITGGRPEHNGNRGF